MRKTATALVCAGLSLGFASGCGDDEDDTTTAAGSNPATTETGGGETVKISETEYAIDPSEVSVKPGEVTFQVSNDGKTVHDLEIEGDGLEEEVEDLDPGASGELTVELAAGQTYEMYCSIADHAAQGMEGTIKVEG